MNGHTYYIRNSYISPDAPAISVITKYYQYPQRHANSSRILSVLRT